MSCEDSDVYYNTPLIGLWEEAVNVWNMDDPEYDNHCEGDDNLFEARWEFKDNGTYYLDFGAVTFSGGISGFSKGEYELLGDSLLIVSSDDHENLGYAMMGIIDTLLVNITDTTFTSSYSFSVFSCKRYWVRMK